MHEVLQHLNTLGGMRGSLVVTPDGLPIAVELPEDMDIETTAGLGACMGKLLHDWAGEVQAGKISVGMMEAKTARFFVSAMVWGYLVAVAEKRCPLGEARLEIRTATTRLNEICSRLTSSLQREEAREAESSEHLGRNLDEQ